MSKELLQINDKKFLEEANFLLNQVIIIIGYSFVIN